MDDQNDSPNDSTQEAGKLLADEAPDDAAVYAMADWAFVIEQRAVAPPVTSASDVLALIVMTSDASDENAGTSQDVLVARAYAEIDAS